MLHGSFFVMVVMVSTKWERVVAVFLHGVIERPVNGKAMIGFCRFQFVRMIIMNELIFVHFAHGIYIYK